ncbi:cytochrome aa3 quinol oxidase subunit IV [Alkalicoccobacillus murimartini]|uniref:Quinol oxidase subunit 4 n=1 Tax=Alkalicoccobacillus murimartini TaxID=171685 RepID=A0ABT9YEP8_9BACI|nr:cytochrome aa3 quinol oxidase subunit IV [Alkalicoccobacillus murimartini]MDQ0206199.1 cytochrome aa3-600 menaquinol oxidase subunit 4 [Alkalicoccobacillus murimartini]
MSQNHSESTKSHTPWTHIIGFIGSIVLTLFAVWIALYTDLSSLMKIIIIFVFAFVQAGVQLLMFMHIREGKDGITQLGHTVFAIFIAVVIVIGSVFVLQFGIHLPQHQ